MFDKYPDCKILACAPSNSAVDLLLERISNGTIIPKHKMVRLNAYGRSLSAVSESIKVRQLYCCAFSHFLIAWFPKRFPFNHFNGTRGLWSHVESHTFNIHMHKFLIYIIFILLSYTRRISVRRIGIRKMVTTSAFHQYKKLWSIRLLLQLWSVLEGTHFVDSWMPYVHSIPSLGYGFMI